MQSRTTASPPPPLAQTAARGAVGSPTNVPSPSGILSPSGPQAAAFEKLTVLSDSSTTPEPEFKKFREATRPLNRAERRRYVKLNPKLKRLDFFRAYFMRLSQRRLAAGR